MKFFLHTFFLIFPLFLFSQNIAITYLVKENTTAEILSTNIYYDLIIKKNESMYFNNKKDSLNQFKHSKFIGEVKKNGDFIRVQIDDNNYSYLINDFYYKNYQTDSLIFNSSVFDKKVIVSESIDLFKWEIQPKSDTTILNFKCQKALTTFRGRKYQAFFSDEVGPYGGPWKFDGLPGTILAVKSLDNRFVIEPISVLLNGKNEDIVVIDPYKKILKLSWGDYKSKMKDKMTLQLKKLKSISEYGETGSVKLDQIEDLEIGEVKF